MIEFCPTCRQPMPPDAMARPGPADIKCHYCDERASFIIYGLAACQQHRRLAQQGVVPHRPRTEGESSS
jgi:hypothetical protein